MRQARIWGKREKEGWNYYHMLSRIRNQKFCLRETEKEYFRELIGNYAQMSRVEVLTWVCMRDHFHLLVRARSKNGGGKTRDEELFRRLAYIMPERRVMAFRGLLERKKRGESGGNPDALREKLAERMNDISTFARELKQRYCQWYNRRYQVQGTVWADRYTSVLIEEKGDFLPAVAAYIDLNPVRAKLVKDPADYRWGAYSHAVEGDEACRHGLMKTVPGGMKKAGARFMPLTKKTWPKVGLFSSILPLVN